MTFSAEEIALLRSSSIHQLWCDIFDEENPSTRECNCDGREMANKIADKMQTANTLEFEDRFRDNPGDL
jgi:hypothetical protein